ncbi:MAG: SusC/RagA family TonB-linked outer membrane protein, partial [Mangrovibacterium sp.]
QGDETEVWLRRLNLSDVEIANYKKGQSTNWKDMVFRTGLEQDYNVNLSGKTDLLTYYWSLGYTNNEGVIVNDDYSVYRSRLRLEAKVTNFLSVGLNTLFSYRDESGVPVSWAMFDNISPWGQPTNEDGTYKLAPTDDMVAARHPLIDSYYTDRKYAYKSLDNVLYAKITLPFNITYELNYSPRITNNEFFQHQSSNHPEWSLIGGKAIRNTENSFSWQIDNILKWKKTFNKIHQIDVTLLANSEKAQAWRQNMSNEGFVPSDVLEYHDIGSGTAPIISSNDTYSTGDAYMGRIFYSYKSKYLLTGTVRRDGYSAFGIKNPRATFPSAALGWVFTEESFLKSPLLSYGKLRLSWGANGNRSIGIYDALSSMSNGMITYVNSSTGTVYQNSYLNASRMGNNLLKWEKTNSFNVGLDLSFFENELNTTVELYSMNTEDLLVDRSLPSVTGYSSVASNLGKINNKGLELTVNSTNIKSKVFTWKTSFNFSMNRNEIKSLYGNMTDVLDDQGNVIGQKEADDIGNKWFIGHAIDEIWDYNTIGVWQTGEEAEAAKYKLAPGDFKLKDVDSNYTFTNDDKEFIGYKKPRFRWSIRNDFNILRNIDFSFSLYSYWGYKSVFDEAKHNPTMTLDRFNSFKIPYWTPENPENNFARLNSNMAGVSYNVWWEKSFIRLDNISLSYNFPRTLLQNYKIENLKILLTARNVAVWTKEFMFWDPEYTGPTPSFVTLGVHLTL